MPVDKEQNCFPPEFVNIKLEEQIEEKHQPCDPIEPKVAVSQISAVNAPVSNMDLSQTSHHNSPNSSENNAVKNCNLKPLSVQLTRLSQNFIDTFTIKVEQDVSESSQEQMRNDDTNLQDIKLETQFSNTNENDLMEENPRAAGCDVRIKTEADESCSNLHHVPIDNEILQDEDDMKNEITSELILKSEHEWSDVEESRDNVHDISDDTAAREIGCQVDTGDLESAVNQVTSYPCQICDRVFKFKPKFTEHLKSHRSNDEGPFECEVCKKIFNKKNEFFLHFKVHLNPYQCKHCGKHLISKEDLNQHIIQAHQTSTSFPCIQCSHSFKKKSLLKKHNQSFHSVKAFKCDTCSKSFKTKQELNIHYRSHNGDRPFACKKCGKTFQYRSSFVTHIKHVHSELRAFECEVCSKKFKTKEQVGTHMTSVHIEDLEFECGQCDKKFKSRQSLIQHIKRHSTLRPFQCAQCSKGFKRNAELVSHMISHSDERPFSCDTCEKTFKYKDHFKQHSKICVLLKSNHSPKIVLSFMQKKFMGK